MNQLSSGECPILLKPEAFGEEGEQGQVVLSDPHGHDEPAKFAFEPWKNSVANLI